MENKDKELTWKNKESLNKAKPTMKKKRKHQKEPNESSHSSDEENPGESIGKSCPHIVKAVNINAVKKNLKTSSIIGYCQACFNAFGTRKTNDLQSGDIGENLTTYWLCLQCGNQGCDRNSKYQHALQHYQTPRSDSHAIVVNTLTWNVWCYDCDDEIFVDSNKKLLECIDFVKKHAKLKNNIPQSIGPKLSLIPENEDNLNTPKSKILEDTPSNIKDKNKLRLKNTDDNGLAGLPQIKGLTNLGNSCFFNAIMQNLSQTQWLCHLLDQHCLKGAVVKLPGTKRDPDYDIIQEDYKDDLPQLDHLEITLPEGGPLTQALAIFLKEMHSTTRNGVINPGQLFSQVCKKSPQFQGARQQDSHELLRHLLDALRTEEVRRQKTGILKAFGFTEKVDPKTVDEETKKKIKKVFTLCAGKKESPKIYFSYGKQATHTLVDSIFSGQLISTVLCEECHMSSQVFEPFLDLSLPIAEEKPARPGLQKKHSNEEPLVESFGASDDKTNKYQKKKARRQAKKEAKKNRSKNVPGENKINLECDVGNKKMSNPKGPQANGRESSLGSPEDEASELSDADIEDNAESESTLTNNQSDKVCPLSPKREFDEVNKDANDEDSVSLSESREGTEAEAQSPASSELQSPRTPVAASAISETHLEDLCSRVKEVTIREKSESKESLLEDTNGYAGEDNNQEKIQENNSPVDTANQDNSGGDTTVEKDSSNEKSWTKWKHQCLKQDWIARSLTTLAPRSHQNFPDCSILSCLNQFTAPELLTGNNKFGCENCAKLQQEKSESKSTNEPELVYSNASKQLLIFSPPAILTLHLKRFQQVGYSLRKINRHVDFPLILDLAPFCSSICLGLPNMMKGQTKVLYSLYGIVEHSGRLTGGHYTAYVKLRSKITHNCQHFLNRKPVGQYEINRLVAEMARKTGGDTTALLTNSSNNEEINEPTESPNGRWFCVSDGHVSEVSTTTVLRSQAYLLFYERIL